MRTKYCPHCGSEKIHRVIEPVGFDLDTYYLGREVTRMLTHNHYHECEDCNETWEHHERV